MIKTDLIQKLDNAIVVCEYVYKLEFLKLKSIEPSLNFNHVIDVLRPRALRGEGG